MTGLIPLAIFLLFVALCFIEAMNIMRQIGAHDDETVNDA